MKSENWRRYLECPSMSRTQCQPISTTDTHFSQNKVNTQPCVDAINVVISCFRRYNKQTCCEFCSYFAYILVHFQDGFKWRIRRWMYNIATQVIYFMPLQIHFHNPRKLQKTIGSVTFSGGIEMEYWREMSCF